MAKPAKYYKNTPVAISDKRTVPAPTAGTGTITTDGIYFTTSANNQLQVGDWVIDESQDEVRQVVFLQDGSSTKGTINAPFSSDLSAISLQYVKFEDINGVYEISLAADYGGDAEYNGVALKSGSSVTFRIPEGAALSSQTPMEPIIVDGTTNSVTAVVSKIQG